MVLFFSTLGCKVLSQKPQENTYYPMYNLNKFVGDWIWTSGTDTVRIRLKKAAVKIPIFNNSYWENLLGCHIYVKNGIVIENTMDKFDSLQYYNSSNRIGSIYLYHIENADTSIAEGTLKDISKHKANQIDLTYLGGNPVQIRMQLSAKPGTTVSLPGNPYIPGITLPTDIILFKQ